MDIPNTDSVNYAFDSAQSQAMQYRHEFITPEHLLSALLEQVPFQKALAECFCTPEELSQSISEYLSKEVERVPQEIEYELEISGQLSELLQYAYMTREHIPRRFSASRMKASMQDRPASLLCLKFSRMQRLCFSVCDSIL